MFNTIHDVLPRLVVRGEQVLNVVLISVTGYHEWGNEVGYACAPLVVFLVLHLIVTVAFGDPE